MMGRFQKHSLYDVEITVCTYIYLYLHTYVVHNEFYFVLYLRACTQKHYTQEHTHLGLRVNFFPQGLQQGLRQALSIERQSGVDVRGLLGIVVHEKGLAQAQPYVCVHMNTVQLG